ncbi:hypothetical protein BAUCODRAFT_25055 [Baudoinia panamericana UAMH 10762]|uniref:Fungal N-terminal domain-containing protein n=1 Tax=Baudoinia panamericana (strain UAMH 10762) TaxID=717646 RepID=M2NB80_BAUPA|nr:uncharacterized protein BAUCODRAFT_25055 [Baudoinia panamericana UAMH 10762]EMC96115.1 hypothetical protein BAUCODRAFT_25055 [Baudoinia panamericana UAMH 10762]
MIDPVNALGAASACIHFAKFAWSVGDALYKLVSDTRYINETVASLAREVKGLGDACNLVHQELDDVLRTSSGGANEQYDKGERLWRSVGSAIGACEETVKQLQRIVDDVKQEHEGFLRQAGRQIRLNTHNEEMEAIRKRISTHTQSMGMILQMVNIKVAHLAPHHATKDLALKLDALEATIQKLQDSLRTGGQQGFQADAGLDIVGCAVEIKQRGTTLFEASVAGSVVGGPELAQRNLRVAEWTSDIELLRRDKGSTSSAPSDSDTYSPTIFSRDGAATLTTLATSPSSQGFGCDDCTVKELEVIEDHEDEFSLDFALEALTAGNQAFDEQKWAEAESCYMEALADLRRLPAQFRAQRDVCDTFELQYKLAICACHTKEPIVARDALIGVLGQAPASDEHRRWVCNAGTMLSKLYIQLGALEAARSSCESVLRELSKLVGKEHDSYYESLIVLARIWILMGNPTRARIYLRKVPEARRGLILEELEASPLPSPQAATSAVSEESLTLSPRLPAYQVRRQNTDGVAMEAITTCTPNVFRADSVRDIAHTPSILDTALEPRRLSEIQQSPRSRDARLSRVDQPPRKPSVPDAAPDRSVDTGSAPYTSLGDIVLPAVHAPHGGTDKIIVRQERSHSNRHLPFSSRQRMDTATRQLLLDRLHWQPRSNLETAICAGRVDEALSIINNWTAAGEAKVAASHLHFAALFGDDDVVIALLRQGVPANMVRTTSELENTVHHPRFSNELPMFFRHHLEPGYVGSGCLYNYLPLHIASEMRWHSTVRLLTTDGPGGSDPTYDRQFGASPGERQHELTWNYHPVLRLFDKRGWFGIHSPRDPQEFIAVIDTIMAWWTTSCASDGCKPKVLEQQVREVSEQMLKAAVLLPAKPRNLRKAVVEYIIQRSDNSASRASGEILHLAVSGNAPEVIPLLLRKQRSEQLNAKWLDRDTDVAQDALCYAVSRAAMADSGAPEYALDCVHALMTAGGNPLSVNKVRRDNVPPRARGRNVLAYRVVTTPCKIAEASGRQDLVDALSR